MRKYVIYLLILLPLPSVAQEWKKTDAAAVKTDLVAAAKHMRADNFSMQFDRRIYRNQTDPQPMTSDKGFFARGKGREYRSEGGAQLVVQNNDLRLLVDTTQHIVLIMQPDTLFNPFDFDAFASGNSWDQFTYMVLETPELIKYQLIPVNSTPDDQLTEMWIDKRTRQLKRMTIYLQQGNYFSETLEDNSDETPMVVVDYAKTAAITGKTTLFDPGSWIIKDNKTYQLAPSAAAMGYRLEDLRYNPDNN